LGNITFDLKIPYSLLLHRKTPPPGWGRLGEGGLFTLPFIPSHRGKGNTVTTLQHVAERCSQLMVFTFFILLVSGCDLMGKDTSMQKSDKPYPSKLDQPRALQYIFHPRQEIAANPPAGAVDYAIRVDEGVTIGCRFYIADINAPSILFFHGNGEIVGDYDDIGPVYNRYGLNLLAVDYRGYGTSGGTPTVTTMLKDSHAIFKEVRQWLKKKNMHGPLWIMGRSLGSASALELASQYETDSAGLIIESGFAYTVPLLDFLGVNTKALGITEADCFRHIEKIKTVRKPTLIIHAQYDQFIPVSDAEAFLKHSPATKKALRIIPGADHNTILMIASRSYFETIKQFITAKGV